MTGSCQISRSASGAYGVVVDLYGNSQAQGRAVRSMTIMGHSPAAPGQIDAELGANTFTGMQTLPSTTPTSLQAATKAYVDAAVGGGGGGVVRSYLAGLGLSNDATSASNTLDVAAGTAADTTNAAMITIAAFKKKTSGAWASGVRCVIQV